MAAVPEHFAYSSPLGNRPDWQRKNPLVRAYKAEYTPSLFHVDNSVIRGLMGPLGSGKSTACCAEIMQRAVRQPPDESGRRRSRWAVIRNTYRELNDTTLQTWLDWFPEEECGPFARGNMTHEIRLQLPDNTMVELDVMFRALDRPADVKKLLSLELTAAWVNEARELPIAIIRMLRRRVARFPSWRDPVIRAAGGYWFGVVMDTNPPDEDHWWYKIFELEHPDVTPLDPERDKAYFGPDGKPFPQLPIFTWQLFRQPSGRGPKAENLHNLPPGYYQDTSGLTPEWIKVYFDGEYGFVHDGKPVYPEYTDSFHCTDWAAPMPGAEIRVGIDFGLTPAAVFVQQDIHGRWRVIDELVTEDMGITRFGELLSAKMQGEYADYKFRFYGDPAGDQRAQTDERSPFMILNAQGITATAARTNDFNVRREAVATPLMRIVDGKPGLAIHPKCRQLRKGMGGKYCYRRVQVVGDERYHDKPDKGMYSHVCEALQYVMLEFGSNPTLTRAQQAGVVSSFIAGSGGSVFDQ